MDTPGSERLSDSTDNIPTDASTATSPIQNMPSASPAGSIANLNTTSIIKNDDSTSDISMSADSDDEDEDGLDRSTLQLAPTTQEAGQVDSAVLPSIHPELSRKRKYSGAQENDLNGHVDPGNIKDIRKRLKPDETRNLWKMDGPLEFNPSLLPAEIWHHIFTFTPPRTLGNLLQVNKAFNTYLDPSSDTSIVPLSKSTAQLLKPDIIWRASRRLFKSLMPVPLVGQTELDMWRMACANSCQFCGKKKPAIDSAQLDQWHPGPGETGVTPIWPFAVRSCGLCLLQNSVKEYELLLSSSVPSLVMPALPFVFITKETHVIRSIALQNVQPPTTIQFTKYYFKPHVEAIQIEFESVRAMGSATVEEWLKGLEDRGKERRNDAARWERWEASGGVSRMRTLEHHEKPKPISTPTNLLPTLGQSVITNGVSTLPTQKPITHPLPQVPKSLPAIHTSFPANPPLRYESPSQNISAYTPRSQQQPKQERTKEEVAELKWARRAEIERRCLSLDPPLTANILAHMSSFQAAIQIIQPLNDGAWEVLKPRIVSQREEAEQRENDRIAQTRVVQERSEERRFQDVQIKPEYKDAMDREWDDVQAPLRARIGGYADETIRDGWNGGDKVTKETSPKFAAEVLIYVRKRFYAEVAKDDAAVRATGREPQPDPPVGPFTRKLTLENMKWVFDTKIKPHTEQYSKELFLCNACENNYRYYGFEGVIQHFAAKHTSTLSVGSIVVHWKSEWPEYPPFNPDPAAAVKNAYYSTVASASSSYPNSSILQGYGYGGYQQPVSASFQPPSPNLYQESPGSYYGHSQYGDQYSAPGNYGAPMYQESLQGYAQYSAPPSALTPGYNDLYAQPGYGVSYPTSSQANYTAPLQAQAYPLAPDNNVQQSSYAPQGASYDFSFNQPSVHSNGNYPPPTPSVAQHHQQEPQVQQPQQPVSSQQPQHSEEYRAQLRDIGRNAKLIWSSISTVKEVPGSVKVHTIIHHILKEFRLKFQRDPPLSMIVEGLSNNKDMRPTRNINGLQCRACVLGMAGSATSKSDKKHFSFPQLVNHFSLVHEQGVPSNYIGHCPDWTKDMVELPDQSKMSSVAHAPGMDGQKLAVFAEALPEIIAVQPSRKSSIKQETSSWQPGRETLESDESAWQPSSYSEKGTKKDLAPSQDNHARYYTTPSDIRASKDDNTAYEEHQYDSHNPRGMQERNNGASASLPTPFHHDQNHQVTYSNGGNRRPSLQRPSSPRIPGIRSGNSNGRYVVHEDAPVYAKGTSNFRHLETHDVEHKPRYERPIRTYEDSHTVPPAQDYRVANFQSYQSNKQEPVSTGSTETTQGTQYRPLEDAMSQQNKIFEVVAQISQQAQQARIKHPTNHEAADAMSEKGVSREGNSRKPPSDEATNAAERFLNNFLPGERPRETAAQRGEKVGPREEGDYSARERLEGFRYKRPTSPGPSRRLREVDTSDPGPPVHSIQMAGEQRAPSGYYVAGRQLQPGHAQAYASENRYVDSVSAPALIRERSHDSIDRRNRAGNVVYRDERQESHGGIHRTPSRYARYESVRLENDHARSRSPVYIKMGAQPGQYVEHSPSTHPSPQEPIYRTRTPDEVVYERAPRQEYYRVYADEPRPRQAYEYVQYDAHGPYIIHRQARREPEAVYAAYDNDPYSRQPVYETHPAVSRTDPAYYEEYDPRHPEPPPVAHEVRYQ